MANIWKQNRDAGQKPKRNNFDLSFQNHSTFKFGYLYPVFCKPVVPGDSFRIDSAFDLKMMPVSFPVQSKIRAHMHYFYCRNKNLWDNFEDWVEGNKTQSAHPHPYVQPADADLVTGSIYDFLGVPTTAVSPNGLSTQLVSFYGYRLNGVGTFNIYPLYVKANGDWSEGDKLSDLITNRVTSSSLVVTDFIRYPLADGKISLPVNATSLSAYLVDYFTNNPNLFYKVVSDGVFISSSPLDYTFDGSNVALSDSDVSAINTLIENGHDVQLVFASVPTSDIATFPAYSTDSKDLLSESFTLSASIASGVQQVSNMNLGVSNNILLNALPYRAYESIYRAFYASSVIQPLVIDGEKEYNKFNTTTADGLDTTDYHLFKRNYELDFLTSALPSPQSGPAPVVGMSALGNITITDENGITTATATTDDSGNITGVQITSPLASVEHGRMLVNIADVGMNINDFRNTNALQNFLEQTLRSGYRYINFIKGHFGVEPKYNELDMPEFIGGYSRDVDISTVVSTSDTANLTADKGSNLGDFGGLGRVVGGSNHSISHFCDDYGWIMGILCITPTPAYSQLLQKEFICPTNYLDYNFPEFNQLGLQPIPYKEVAPIQTLLEKLSDPSVSLEDTFGYQRPNYNLVASVDEVHGEFRNTLRQYLINRIFDGRPELSSAFLEINPSEINDVFVNQNPDDDVFIGHLAFRVQAKRPYPRIHMPSLGK